MSAAWEVVLYLEVLWVPAGTTHTGYVSTAAAVRNYLLRMVGTCWQMLQLLGISLDFPPFDVRG